MLGVPHFHAALVAGSADTARESAKGTPVHSARNVCPPQEVLDSSPQVCAEHLPWVRLWTGLQVPMGKERDTGLVSGAHRLEAKVDVK